MTNKEFVESINIISKYIPEECTRNLCMEHDQIWFGEYEWVTVEEDVSRLEEIGWYESEDSWCIDI